jgi:SAM-dependent methyltransferase
MPEQSSTVDLYNSAYGHYEAEVYREIRLSTYGQDFGQTSWVTTEESNEIPRLLALKAESNVLEIGSGSGRYALHLANSLGCRVLGVDVNEFAITNANRLAAETPAARARFEVCDVSQPLPFADSVFSAVFSNDVICHIPQRPSLFCELFRVLRRSGKLLFSDALVIGGTVSHEEIAARSSIGYYLFSPQGENECLLAQAGFSILASRDTTANAAAIASCWLSARAQNREQLIALEGENNFEGLQRFLSCVHQLTSERRLLRFLYLAQKP